MSDKVNHIRLLGFADIVINTREEKPGTPLTVITRELRTTWGASAFEIRETVEFVHRLGLLTGKDTTC